MALRRAPGDAPPSRRSPAEKDSGVPPDDEAKLAEELVGAEASGGDLEQIEERLDVVEEQEDVVERQARSEIGNERSEGVGVEAGLEDIEVSEDVEPGLDDILRLRVEAETGTEPLTTPADLDMVPTPVAPDEFVCRSCFLVKRRTQLTDRERMWCRDCTNNAWHQARDVEDVNGTAKTR